MTHRNLPLHYAIQVKCTEGWLALGLLDEAMKEWKKLPQVIRLHPDAAVVRAKLLQCWRSIHSTAEL